MIHIVYINQKFTMCKRHLKISNCNLQDMLALTTSSSSSSGLYNSPLKCLFCDATVISSMTCIKAGLSLSVGEGISSKIDHFPNFTPLPSGKNSLYATDHIVIINNFLVTTCTLGSRSWSRRKPSRRQCSRKWWCMKRVMTS